eukprot:scaffold200837_cov56-Attheya_sp.AAC.1
MFGTIPKQIHVSVYPALLIPTPLTSSKCSNGTFGHKLVSFFLFSSSEKGEYKGIVMFVFCTHYLFDCTVPRCDTLNPLHIPPRMRTR